MLAAGDIDLDKVLVHHTSGAQVHVTHFGVAHLAVGKADELAAGLQVAGRVFCTKGIDVRGALGPDSVGIVVATFAPTIQNHQ